MNTAYMRNVIILIGIIFVAAIVFGIIQQPRVDTEEITSYLEEMAPVAQAHSEWKEDYKTLTGLYGVLSPDQKLEQLNTLLNRMEELRINVDESTPPGVLDNVRANWSNECFKTTQGIYDITLGLTMNDVGIITEGYEMLAEADTSGQKWQNELSELLNKNDIGLSDSVYSSYFGQG